MEILEIVKGLNIILTIGLALFSIVMVSTVAIIPMVLSFIDFPERLKLKKAYVRVKNHR